MTDAIAATFSDLRIVKGRKVVQFIFEVPREQADAALKLLGGVPQPDNETWVGIAPIQKPSGSVETDRPAGLPPAGAEAEPPPAAPPRLSWYGMRPSQRAALLCKDQRFWEWANKGGGALIRDASDARLWMLERYGITSRSDLDSNLTAASPFTHDEIGFRIWAGLEPDPNR